MTAKDMAIEHLADDAAVLREWVARYRLAYTAAVGMLAEYETRERQHAEQRERLVEENRRLRAEIMRADIRSAA